MTIEIGNWVRLDHWPPGQAVVVTDISRLHTGPVLVKVQQHYYGVESWFYEDQLIKCEAPVSTMEDRSPKPGHDGNFFKGLLWALLFTAVLIGLGYLALAAYHAVTTLHAPCAHKTVSFRNI